MKLSLDAIQIIDAIARTGSMSAAAVELHKVPSSISYSVSKLEQQLQLSLFERNGPHLSLTPAGQALLSEGRWLIQAFADLECRLHRIASGYETELRIVYDALLPSHLWIDDIRAFNTLECGTRLRFTTETMTGVWEALHEERADLVIAIGDCPKWRGYQVLQIDSIDFAFCVAPQHPLCQLTQPIPAEQLFPYHSIAVADSARNLPTRTVGALAGQKRITVADIHAKIALQQQGLGIGFLPRKLVQTQLQQGHLIELTVTTPRPADPVWLAMRADEQGEAAQWWFARLQRKVWP